MCEVTQSHPVKNFGTLSISLHTDCPAERQAPLPPINGVKQCGNRTAKLPGDSQRLDLTRTGHLIRNSVGVILSALEGHVRLDTGGTDTADPQTDFLKRNRAEGVKHWLNKEFRTSRSPSWSKLTEYRLCQKKWGPMCALSIVLRGYLSES